MKKKEDETTKMNAQKETIALDIQTVRYQLDEKNKSEHIIRQTLDSQRVNSKQFLEKYKGIELDASTTTLNALESALKKPDFITSKIEQSMFDRQVHLAKIEQYKKQNIQEVSSL